MSDVSLHPTFKAESRRQKDANIRNLSSDILTSRFPPSAYCLLSPFGSADRCLVIAIQNVPTHSALSSAGKVAAKSVANRVA